MTIVETFSDFVSAAAKFMDEKPADWRAGQAAFNLLDHVRPDIAEMVRGSDYDPFHIDGRLVLFYDFAYRHWGI